MSTTKTVANSTSNLHDDTDKLNTMELMSLEKAPPHTHARAHTHTKFVSTTFTVCQEPNLIKLTPPTTVSIKQLTFVSETSEFTSVTRMPNRTFAAVTCYFERLSISQTTQHKQTASPYTCPSSTVQLLTAV